MKIWYEKVIAEQEEVKTLILTEWVDVVGVKLVDRRDKDKNYKEKLEETAKEKQE